MCSEHFFFDFSILFLLKVKMPFANIRISKGSRVLHGWYIHPIPCDHGPVRRKWRNHTIRLESTQKFVLNVEI